MISDLKSVVPLWLVAGLLLVQGVGRSEGPEANPRVGVVPRAATGAGDPLITGPLEISPSTRAKYPDVAVDNRGVTWVVWLSSEGGATSPDRILLRGIRADGTPLEPLVVDEGPGVRLWPRVLVDGSHLSVAWSVNEGGVWGVRAVVLGRERGGEFHKSEVQQISDVAVDAFRPALVASADGRIWVSWEERHGSRLVLKLRALDADPSETVTLASAGELNQRVTLASAYDGHLWAAWDSYDRGEYSVWLKNLDGIEPAYRVSPEGGWHSAPALVPARDGTLWLAWHTDVGPEGRWSVGSRIRVRALRDGRLWDTTIGDPPPAPVTLGGQVLPGVETLEFASMATAPDGRLWVTARRGQGFVGWLGASTGWTGPYDLASRGWGGWGRDMKVVQGHDGGMVMVARLLRTIGLFRVTLPLPEGKGPGLVPLRQAVQVAGGVKVPEDRSILEREVSASLARGPINTSAQAAGTVGGGTDWVRGGGVSSPTRSMRPGPGGGEGGGPLPSPAELVVGDLHTHSWLSDGTGDPDYVYTRSRDEGGLDFVALTDHDVTNANYLTYGEFLYNAALADLFYQPGSFVTFHAWEWTSPSTGAGGAGHKNIYLPGGGRTFFSYAAGNETTPQLFEHLREVGAIAIPHHVGWTGTDWQNHDPAVQAVVEICSVHGAFEYPHNKPVAPRANLPGMFIRNGLDKGLVFGLVGGSDGHGVAWHYGVSRRENPWKTGLTGAWVGSLTREGVMGAMMRRRVYATSGVPVQLHLQVEQTAMGGELSLNTLPRFVVQVEGTAPLRSVHLVRDGGVETPLSVSGASLRSQVQERNLPPGNHYYYLRVVQTDGEMAWSSPVFLDYDPRRTPTTSVSGMGP